MRAVRSKFPDAHISVLARPYVADIYRGLGVSDELIAYDPIAEHRGWSGRNKLIANLRSKHFDVALLLQNAFDAAWLAWRAEIPERIGYARDARRVLLTKAIAVPKPDEIPPHEKFYYLELVRRAGWLDALPQADHITLQVSDSARQHAAQTLIDAGSRPRARRIAIGAGASYGSAKCWPPESFAEWANRFLAQNDADVILFGTAAEAGVSNAIIANMRRKPIDLTGKTAIADLPALLSQCHLFLGNDSGAMHVAAAVGLPVVASSAPPILSAPRPLLRAAPSFSKSPIAAPVSFAAVPPIIDV